jgi:hypothetical protein
MLGHALASDEAQRVWYDVLWPGVGLECMRMPWQQGLLAQMG